MPAQQPPPPSPPPSATLPPPPPSPPSSAALSPPKPTPPFPAPQLEDAPLTSYHDPTFFPHPTPSSAIVPPVDEPPIAHLRRRLAHLASPLHALLSVASGQAHPDFPRTLLHYHLLTEAQLDALARFYHQDPPCALSFAYPAPVAGRWREPNRVAGGGLVQDKRRRFGRFVGLRGCESPREAAEGREGIEGDEDGGREALQRAIQRWVDEKIRSGMDREREIDNWRSKGW